MESDLLANTRIQVQPMGGAIGAEVRGVDLAQPMDDATFAEIHEAFLTHHVLFFREQQMDAHSLAAFGERFGALTLAPQSTPIPEHPFVSRIRREPEISSLVRNIGDRWHSDQSPRERPNLGFLLYCMEAPPYGGDTMFANMQIAYDRLSSGMQALCDGLTVIHSAAGIYNESGGRPLFHAGVKEDEGARQRTLAIINQETEHPLVRVSPENGRRCLYLVGDYAIRFKDMTREESLPLFNFLQAHATRPEFTCRFRWEKGSVALLDNRCTQHYAINDYSGYAREMLRVEMDGERPLSIAAAREAGIAEPTGLEG